MINEVTTAGSLSVEKGGRLRNRKRPAGIGQPLDHTAILTVLVHTIAAS